MATVAGGRRGPGFCSCEEADAGRPRSNFAKPAPTDNAIVDSPVRLALAMCEGPRPLKK